MELRNRRLSILILALLVRKVLADAQCYGVNGQKSSATPCRSDATGQAGSHSACCDQTKQEACLSTGLCYASQRRDNNTFWSEGCTDPQGLDSQCPQYCGASSQSITAPLQTSYTMMFCGPDAWCCCFDSFGKQCSRSDCCARNFSLARGLGQVTRQFGAADLSSPANTPQSSSGGGGGGGPRDGFDLRRSPLLAAIVGGVLGSLLLATIVALVFSHRHNRHLRRQIETLQTRTQSGVFGAPGLAPLVTPQTQNKEEILMSPVSYHRMRTPSEHHTPSTTSGGFTFPMPPTAPARTPSFPRSSDRRGGDGGGAGGGTAELADPRAVSELPAEKYLG